jgi:hypothetical protein
MEPVRLARSGALVIAGGRVVAGLAMSFAPRLVAGQWIGRDARRAGPQLLIRTTGGRDLALGAGALGALATGRGARPWIAAQAAADLTDLVATALAGDDLPAAGRRAVIGLAGGAAVLGLATLFGQPAADSRASAARAAL